MQHSTYQTNNQFLLMGVTIFASITAAVIISTLIIMSLMRGEIASALTSNVQNSTPVAQNTGTCTVPADEGVPAEASAAATGHTGGGSYVAFTSGVKSLHHMPAAVSHSFNTTNTTNTTNNVSNTEVKTNTTNTTVMIKDSFNKDSYNDNSKNPVIVKDNTVNVNSNNGNSINSGNTLNHNSNNTTNTAVSTNTTTNTTNNTTTTVNTNSNNTTNTSVSSVIENHVLSDNTVVAL